MSNEKAEARNYNDIGEPLVKATFLFFGPAPEQGKSKFGTVFLVNRPVEGVENGKQQILVTADHVLREIQGDSATLVLRKYISGKWEELPVKVQIRKGGNDLWTRHTTLDVAAFHFLPCVSPQDLETVKGLIVDVQIESIPVAWFANDASFTDAGINIGTELNCLGFPMTLHSLGTGRFPVLRGGKLASYPLIPSKDAGAYYFDFEIFPGNSGGPVYYRIPYFRLGGKNPSDTNIIAREGIHQAIAGLVSSQVSTLKDDGKTPDKELKMGVVIPSSAILETIDLLPKLDVKAQ